jgi:hypothetical protein
MGGKRTYPLINVGGVERQRSHGVSDRENPTFPASWMWQNWPGKAMVAPYARLGVLPFTSGLLLHGLCPRLFREWILIWNNRRFGHPSTVG